MRNLCSLVLFLSVSSCLHAQSGDTKPLFHAAELRDAGRFSDEIAYLLPFLQPESHVLDTTGRGVAWDILGLAYQDVAHYEEAQHCYETAISMLSQHSADAAFYAAALDNFGSLKLVTGDTASSIRLREQAEKISEQLGDHAGAARALGNLARVAIAENDQKALRTYLEAAFREAKLAGHYPDGEMAALLADQASLLSFQNNDQGALVLLNQAIALWVRSYGPDYFMLGAGYALRAQAYDRLGDTQRAELDMQHALTILAKTAGSGTPGYRKTQLIYAGILRHAGDLQRASLLEEGMRHLPAGMQQHPCNGCSLSAASTR